jgi:antitoxin HicB
MKTPKNHPNLGSSLDDLLAEDGVAAEVDAAALKRVVALQIEDEMKRAHVSKASLARRMRTSRVAVDRLLDTTQGSVTLNTLGRAATALGRRLKVELV